VWSNCFETITTYLLGARVEKVFCTISIGNLCTTEAVYYYRQLVLSRVVYIIRKLLRNGLIRLWWSSVQPTAAVEV
jgi:hypothetical protein